MQSTEQPPSPTSPKYCWGPMNTTESALVFVGSLLALGLLLGAAYLCGRRCAKPRAKTPLSEPLLSVNDSVMSAGVGVDPVPKEVWAQDALLLIPLPKETIASLQVAGVLSDSGALVASSHLPRFLATLSAQGAPDPAVLRDQGVGWVALPSIHRAELWCALLATYGPLAPAFSSLSSASQGTRSIGRSGSVFSEDPLLTSPGRMRGASGADQDVPDVDLSSVVSPSAASQAGVHVQHKDDHDLIFFDAQRCKFPKFRSEPGAGRLEGLIRRWVKDNPSCQYYQSLNVVAAVVLEVFGEDPPMALAVFQRVVDVFLSGLLHRQALHKVAEVRRLSQFLLLLGYWDPEVAVLMCDQGLNPELYAIPWLSTLFADTLDLPDALRVWDVMLCLDSRFPVFLSVAFLAQARGALLKVTNLNSGLLTLNHVKDTETAGARIAECTKLAVNMWVQSPGSVGHVDSGPLTAQLFTKTGHRRTTTTRSQLMSADFRTPRHVSTKSHASERHRLESEVVLGTGDVAEFEVPDWTPQFEPWYSPGSPPRSPTQETPQPVRLFPPETPQRAGTQRVPPSPQSSQEDLGVDVLAHLSSHSHRALSVDVALAAPSYDVSIDVLSPFVSPTPTAAAACVIAGIVRKGSMQNIDTQSEESLLSGSAPGERQKRQDDLAAWDVIVGEALPVARLQHLATLPPDGVCIIDIRNCSPVEHSVFVSRVNRLAPHMRVLHCPAASLRPQHTGTTPVPTPVKTDIEMVLSDHDTSVHVDRALGEAFRYTSTGGLDVDMMNSALVRPGGDSVCALTIASSLQHRPYGRVPGILASRGVGPWLARACPTLAALRGMCLSLYADADMKSLVEVRDTLIRAGFVGVCGLSQTCLFAVRLDET